jgi:hypothetical protein
MLLPISFAFIYFYHISSLQQIPFMLGGSLVTMAGHVLRLQMEEMAKRYGG